MPAMSAAFVLPLILLIFLVSFSFLALPLAPTLKVTFKITSQIYPPAVQVTEAIYNKVSLFATTSTTKGNIILSYLGVTTGSYSLFIAVSYGATTLSTDTFSPLGDGLYQLSVTYLPRWGGTVKYALHCRFHPVFVEWTACGKSANHSISDLIMWSVSHCRTRPLLTNVEDLSLIFSSSGSVVQYSCSLDSSPISTPHNQLRYFSLCKAE